MRDAVSARRSSGRIRTGVTGAAIVATDDGLAIVVLVTLLTFSRRGEDEGAVVVLFSF